MTKSDFVIVICSIIMLFLILLLALPSDTIFSIFNILKNLHIFYFILNIIAIVLVSMFFAHKCSRDTDKKIEIQEINMTNKVIKMFKEAFKIIKKSGML